MKMDFKQKTTSKQKSIKNKKTLMDNDSRKNTSLTIAYLRASTIAQNLKKNRADILKIAKNKNLGQVQFIEEKVSGKISWEKRKIAAILEELHDNDNIISRWREMQIALFSKCNKIFAFKILLV